MKSSIAKFLVMVGTIAIIVLLCFVKNFKKVGNYEEKYAGLDLSTDVTGVNREGTYAGYLEAHKDAADATQDVEVPLLDYVSGTDVKEDADHAGCLYTGDAGEVTWELDVPEAGFYNIKMEYLTVESRGVAIERSFLINGKAPFNDAELIAFTRMWTDETEPKVDNQGNEIRPRQVEIFDWQTAYCEDELGYETEPYKFYFEKGNNTLTMKTVNEPIIIRELTLAAVSNTLSYEEYRASAPSVSASEEGKKYKEIIQGEDSNVRSESSLYAKYDRASATTIPYSVTKTILNYTGGEVWAKAGQWIQWDITVPEDGFYHISVKGRQNYARGSVSSRTLYIDGEIPFEEAKRIDFPYSNDWSVLTLADENNEPYEFYLTKGTHTLRLEAGLGSMGTILSDLEDSTYRLNQIYRKILVYTGASPDTYRDYNIDQYYPEVIEAMDLESKRLYKLIDDVVKYTGQKADKIATAQTLARQL